MASLLHTWGPDTWYLWQQSKREAQPRSPPANLLGNICQSQEQVGVRESGIVLGGLASDSSPVSNPWEWHLGSLSLGLLICTMGWIVPTCLSLMVAGEGKCFRGWKSSYIFNS